MKHLPGLLGLVLCLAAPLAAAQTSCPNERATQIPGSITRSDAWHRCGVGFVILGVGGALIGAPCPEYKLNIPSHQECQGEELYGHQCVKEGIMEVELAECACGGLVIPGINLGIPTTCVCDDWMVNGTIEDFATQPCPAVVPTSAQPAR